MMGVFSGLTVQQRLMASAGAVAIVAMASPAMAQTRTFNVPAGPASRTIPVFAKQAGVQILASGDTVKLKRTKSVKGTMPVDEALRRLLAGTGLEPKRGAGGTGIITIVKADVGNGSTEGGEGYAGVPEILVVAEKSWSLNTGIERTEDDAQPYTIFTKEQIERSASSTLEDFLRDNLGANTSYRNSDQIGGSLGRSFISLRGLSSMDTLILVDGRRVSGVASRGELGQGSITGIPLASIERIEVLASSASGIYGASATGGVINIILKRDYRGVQLSANYAGTFEGGAEDRRLDLNGGFALEGGKTKISFSGSVRKLDPLLQGQRDLFERGRRFSFEQNPNVFIGATAPPLGGTPNIRAVANTNLTLDPQYGGASLGSRITYIPVRYRGLAQDGVAGLVANAGQYNLDLAPTATANSGAGSHLLKGSEVYSGSLAIRRDFTPWLSLYAEASYSKRKIRFPFASPFSTTTRLSANAPNNPFQQAIDVTVPHVGTDQGAVANTVNRRFLAGGIVKLAYDWQAVADFSWNRTRFNSQTARNIDAATIAGLANGTLDIMRDLKLSPLSYGFLDDSILPGQQPTISKSQTASLRLAGPLPLTLPGGNPVVTLLVERNRNASGDDVGYSNSATLGRINYIPARSQVTKSAYGEIRIPLIGEANNIPLVEELEFQIAARYDQYVSVGAPGAEIICLSVTRPLTANDLSAPCPPAGQVIQFGRSKRSVVDPTVSLRWKPVRDITVRASYARGFLPPMLAQLVKVPTPFVGVGGLSDPERGNELLGVDFGDGIIVPGILLGPGNFVGGNPDVLPEISNSWTAGVIATPQIVPGLRLSVDWTYIRKKNNYFDPTVIFGINPLLPDLQNRFEEFYRRYPDRFMRAEPSGGFAVGPITGIDTSISNLSGSKSISFDFSLDYQRSVGDGTLMIAADATYLHTLSVQLTDNAPFEDKAGTFNDIMGGLRWKGNWSAIYSTDQWSLGYRGRYSHSYYLNSARTVVPSQGSAKVPSHIFHDIFGSYRLFAKTELRAGINNIFNRKPNIDVTELGFNSAFGDVRLANFYMSIKQEF